MHSRHMYGCGGKNFPISFGRGTVLIRGGLAERVNLFTHTPQL